jgi:hypothetical protein
MSEYCAHPLTIGAKQKQRVPVDKEAAKRMKRAHKIFDLWKAGKYIPSTHRNKEPSNA